MITHSTSIPVNCWLQQIEMKRFFLKYRYLHSWLLAEVGILMAFFFLRQNRTAMNFLTQKITNPLRYGIGELCEHVPFSVAEVLYVIFFLSLLAFLIFGIREIVRSREKRGTVYRLCMGLIVALAGIYAAFCLLWGANYYADGFCEKSGLADEPVHVESLYRVTKYFAAQANAYAQRVERMDGAVDASAEEILSYAPEIYSALYDEFPFLEMEDSVPKAMIFSRIMSMMGFTGLYFPFTGESNINVDFPVTTMPTTVAHELAHRRGIASEQECNFVGILAAIKTENVLYRYSGWLSGYQYLASALYKASPELWREVYAVLSDTVIADLRVSSAYWAQFEGPVEKVSNQIYDGFLKSYGNTLGVKSYGACVDLLVAYFEEEALNWLRTA
mgnify:CR=1 FL=1